MAAAKLWQLRLSVEEDERVSEIAKRLQQSKNDVVKRAIRLLAMTEEVTSNGGRLLVERSNADGDRSAVEVWLL